MTLTDQLRADAVHHGRHLAQRLEGLVPRQYRRGRSRPTPLRSRDRETGGIRGCAAELTTWQEDHDHAHHSALRGRARGALAVLALTNAQEPLRAPTIEERIVALERGLATIDTRFGMQSTRLPDLGGESAAGLAARVDAVERSLERLANDLQRVARVARDSGTRRGERAARRKREQAARDARAAQRGDAPPASVGPARSRHAPRSARCTERRCSTSLLIASRTARCADDVAALLDPKLVTPYRHRARAVCAHVDAAAVDDVANQRRGKLAVAACDRREIGHGGS